MSNYNTLPVKPLMDVFLKLQDHYKIVFMPKNDLVISQAYAPILNALRIRGLPYGTLQRGGGEVCLYVHNFTTYISTQ